MSSDSSDDLDVEGCPNVMACSESLSSVSLPSDIEMFSVSDDSSLRGETESFDLFLEDDPQQPSTSAASDQIQVQKRRKRHSFRKGKLFRKKDLSSCCTSQENSEVYANSVRSRLRAEIPDVDDSDEADSRALSCPSTVPSEGDNTGDEEEQRKKKVISTSRRRKRAIGRKMKYSWKKLDSTEEASDGECERRGRKDFGASVNPKDLYGATIDLITPTSSTSEILMALANYLKITLADSWTVSHADNALYLCKITNPLNPLVERAITWNGKESNFFVHNRQVPFHNPIWQSEKPNLGSCSSIRDYLSNLATQFLGYEICSGIQSHEHVWDKYSKISYVDSLSGIPVLHSVDCSLLNIYPGKCINCRKVMRKMLDRERKQAQKADDGQGNQSKINNRYLEPEQLLKKMARIQQEKALSQQAVNRLKIRIDKLLKENSENIESELGDDFVAVMNQNTHKMTCIEKLFWEQQSKSLSKRDALKTMRWHPSMIRLALQLKMISSSAYKFMSGVISLPSERRLFDYSQFIDVKEGVQEELLKLLFDSIEVNCTEDYHKYFNLLLDEMSIRSELVYYPRTGELIGYTNLSSLEEESLKLEAEIHGRTYEKKLAKKVLVFMLNGCINELRCVPAVYLTDDLSASQLYRRTWDVINAVEEVGAKVLTVICDGASMNRKFINMHTNAGDTDFVYTTKNRAAGEPRLIYFMIDPPHLIKTFQNCFANSFAHRKSRALCNNNQLISWQSIKALYNATSKDKFKGTKLSRAHVHLTSFSCMKVSLAVQVLSESVAKALQRYRHTPLLQDHYNEEVVTFITFMNKWFDCLNGSKDSKKKDHNVNLFEYSSVDDPRFLWLKSDFMKYLEDWNTFVKNREGNYSKDARSRMIISFQSLEGIKITTHSFIKVTTFLLEKHAPWVSARRFNQDPLEQYFSDLRRVRGADNNPTGKQLLHSNLAYQVVGQMTSGSKRGNTEDLRKFRVEATPLPVRKKSKK